MFLINCLVLIITYVNLVSTQSTDCGDWILLGDKKCIKIIDKEKFVDYENGIKLCAETENSNLVTIHSEIEQKFIEKYLFKDNKIVDNVWIGLKNENGFKWSDKSSVDYTNWADKSPINNAERNCVQISTEASLPGKWVNEFCNKKAVVVCQKTMDYKTLSEENKNLRKEIEDLKARLKTCDKGVIPTDKTPTDKPVIASDVTELTKGIKQFHSHYNISKPFIDFDNKHKVLFTVWNNTYNEINATETSFSLCKSLNSNIIEIRSKEKQGIVDKQLTEWNLDYFWLNGKKDSSGKWRWNSDGTEFSFKNWNSDEPQTHMNYDLVYLYFNPQSKQSFWFSTYNSDDNHIICEHNLK